MVEKATELGVTEIRPFEATRSERGLRQAAGKRRQRWEKIAQEASQQARRARLPMIAEAVSFSEATDLDARVKLTLDEESDVAIWRCFPEMRSEADRIGLLLGPEGGFTDEERDISHAKGWQSCSLGGTVLRAETAAAAGVSVVRVAWLP